MGQTASSWCRDGPGQVNEIALQLRGGFSCQADGSLLDSTRRGPEVDVDLLLEGCPRELADALRGTRQWDVLRCRSWLSSQAFRSLQNSLQRCNLRAECNRHIEAEDLKGCRFALPHVVRWDELDCDHVINAGQTFRLDEADATKLQQYRRLGVQALRQGKVAVVLLAGGGNFRLEDGGPVVGCRASLLQLPSGKSTIQLICERIRRMVALCTRLQDVRPKATDEDAKRTNLRPSIPMYVMTSRLTHRDVTEHFEANDYFGIPSRDVFFFEQEMHPVLNDKGQLLAQSLGGEFAHAPGGTGDVLTALAKSSYLEQMRDRGIDCLHIIGVENLLARVCDPIFLGFCREMEIDCACKVVPRLDVKEQMEIFGVRQGKVATNYADIEESAYGVSYCEAPSVVIDAHTVGGDLGFSGSINSFFMSLPFAEEVVERPARYHQCRRRIPHLDFTVEAVDPDTEEIATVWPSVVSAPALPPPRKTSSHVGIFPGSWPPERFSPDMRCQRNLAAAATEVRFHCHAEPTLESEVWRCEVHLDADGPNAVVQTRKGDISHALLENSLCGPIGSEVIASEQSVQHVLRCSLVVPSHPNAIILESSVLDYFAYTDRAIAVQVDRTKEYAPIDTHHGLQHNADVARSDLLRLHNAWLLHVGGIVATFSYSGSEGPIEVSPLVSYEGEGLASWLELRGMFEGGAELPRHLTADGEERPAKVDKNSPTNSTIIEENEYADGLDTRPFYFQEYPQRMALSRSHAPRFRLGPGVATGSESTSSMSHWEAECCGQTRNCDVLRGQTVKKLKNQGM